MNFLRKQTRFLTVLGIVVIGLGLTGCGTKSYPGDRLQEDLAEICKKEYGIVGVRAKVVDKTLGVYLPLSNLFASTLSDSTTTIDNIFEPSQDALDKIEDVLFSISRVILSTDQDLEFYSLQATDTEVTGLQLILQGAVNDIKRVRIWDIPRSEYRKRVIHDIRMNKAVLWHRSVKEFIADLAQLTAGRLKELYLSSTISEKTVEMLFFNLLPSQDPIDVTSWEIEDIRSTELNSRSAVVYAKIKPVGVGQIELMHQEETLEYLFIVTMKGQKHEISRIIPFQYLNQYDQYEKIDFPSELQIAGNLSKWNQEFTVNPTTPGLFLAQQLTKRVQIALSMDERIRNTIREAKVEFVYNEATEPSHFVLNMDVRLRDFNSFEVESVFQHEDMSYVLELASREFVQVMRGYQFGDYDYLQLNLVQDPSPLLLGREELELFRRNKIDIQSLLSALI